MYDTEKGYQTIFDQEGNCYIVTDEKIFFTYERCSIKAYDIGVKLTDFKNSNDTFVDF